MGLFAHLSTIVHPSPRAMTSEEYNRAFFSGDPVPEPWLGSPLGGMVSPEVALTLTYVYCAVSTISDDFGTSTCQMFEDLGNDAKARVKYSETGIGALARKLRWKPNWWQTAKAFWSTLSWQYLLRPVAYAEIIYRGGPGGFIDQLVPRHPDRVRQETLPSGRIRYKLLREPTGEPRYVTQEEMFVVRNTSTDGLNALSRIDYGAKAIASGLSLQDFTNNYFKKGATAALVATYKGEQDEENEVDLHKSIMRYVGGAENAGGVLVIPQDIDIKTLGVDPEKSELLGLKNLSGRDVARLFKMPPSWLAIEGANAYNSQVQDATNYVNRCQVPVTVEFEQAIQRDLILEVDRYFAKFNLDYLLRADLLARAQAYEVMIRSRVIRPSEARVKEDLSPDPALDRLSERDNQPGAAKTGSANPQPAQDERRAARAQIRPLLSKAAQAVTCVRKERAIVTKLAQKHASDPDGWKDALKDFYTAHAGEVADRMRMPIETARMFCAQHGDVFEKQGIVIINDAAGAAWEHDESVALAELALESEA